MEIVLPNCVVRSFRSGDAVSLARHANDRRIWRNLKDSFPHPYTLDHARGWIEQNSIEVPHEFAIVVADQVVGGIGLAFKTDIWRYSAELGYWLAPEYWGRGIMSSVLRAVVDYAFATFDLNRLWAGAFYWNPASVRVLEKVGFVFEARLIKSAYKDGEFVDEVIYAIVRPMTDPRT
ncbi:MAG: GNAT family N-acetyltransferase [Gemmatimonadaceae bacterium]